MLRNDDIGEKMNESRRSEATLVCDFSEAELNRLLLTSDVSPNSPEMEYNQQQQFSQGRSQSSVDSQVNRLNDDEENVDFMAMYDQFQMHRAGYGNVPVVDQQLVEDDQAVLMGEYGPYESSAASNSATRQRQQYGGSLISNSMQHLQVPNTNSVRDRKGNRNMRPNSAKVGGTYGLSNFSSVSKRRTDQIEEPSYSYQAQLPLMNNLTNAKNSGSKFGSRRRTRPQSAVKNQLLPAKNLRAVTNFTYKKARQNQMQKAFLPESLINTDKERLYEEKIELKKRINEMAIINQQLRTKVVSQENSIKKREDEFKQVMQQMFHSAKKSQSSSFADEEFLIEFQQRELNHATKPSMGYRAAAIVSRAAKNNVKSRGAAAAQFSSSKGKVNGSLSTKDSQIVSLKCKVNEMRGVVAKTEKELSEMKKTVKYTKITEYETELALNVQESKRLQMLLEAEIRKPKLDAALMQQIQTKMENQSRAITGLKKQNEMHEATNNKLARKVETLGRRVQKLRDTKKKINMRNKRLDRQVKMLKAQLMEAQKALEKKEKKKPVRKNVRVPQNQNENEMLRDMIHRMAMKMEAHGLEFNEVEYLPAEHPAQLEAVMEESEPLGVDIAVSFENSERILNQSHCKTFENLKEEIRREFELDKQNDFNIKVDGLELSNVNWDNIIETAQSNQGSALRLEIEMLGKVSEVSNAYEDDFEDIPAESERPKYLTAIKESEVKRHLTELKFIFQIKGVKRSDSLQYLLSGARDENGKKVKKVSTDLLIKQIDEKIGFKDATVAEKLARYVMEKPEEGTKVLNMADNDFEGQKHNEAVTMKRKDLQERFISCLDDYMVLNGIALTSLLNRINTLFGDHIEELYDDLYDQDEEDNGTVPFELVQKSIKIMLSMVPDEEILEFLQFLAMRHSQSLDEINYQKLTNAMHEDFNLVEDDRPIWLKEEEPITYDPSDDEGELDSDIEPTESPGVRLSEENEQNDLLERVDEILQQIVNRLPSEQKVRTLTGLMLPYLQPLLDEVNQRKILIISQANFVEFLRGPLEQRKLSLQFEDDTLNCLLHLLVQESGSGNESDNIILHEEFIELVKTYMKKELIMQTSKQLGIHYDILGKESVEFLFKIRSGLMNGEEANGITKQLRELFAPIIQRKLIALRSKTGGRHIEVLDFQQLLDHVRVHLDIDPPSDKAQEELKYLICLDFKYLEILMMIKLNKIMQDIDYISIDLLRKAKDPEFEEIRQQTMAELRRTRQEHLSLFKASKNMAKNNVQGVSSSTQQEKKRKRPDDRVSKKAANRPTSAVKHKSVRQVDFDNIDVNMNDDDIQKVSGPLIEDDDVDIPIDEDDGDIEEEIGGFTRMKSNAPEDAIEEDLDDDGPLLRKKTTFIRLDSGEIDDEIPEEDEAGHGFKRMQTNMPEDDIEEDVDEDPGPALKRKRTSFIRLDGEDEIDEELDMVDETQPGGHAVIKNQANSPEDDIEEEEFDEGPALKKKQTSFIKLESDRIDEDVPDGNTAVELSKGEQEVISMEHSDDVYTSGKAKLNDTHMTDPMKLNEPSEIEDVYDEADDESQKQPAMSDSPAEDLVAQVLSEELDEDQRRLEALESRQALMNRQMREEDLQEYIADALDAGSEEESKLKANSQALELPQDFEASNSVRLKQSLAKTSSRQGSLPSASKRTEKSKKSKISSKKPNLTIEIESDDYEDDIRDEYQDMKIENPGAEAKEQDYSEGRTLPGQREQQAYADPMEQLEGASEEGQSRQKSDTYDEYEGLASKSKSNAGADSEEKESNAREEEKEEREGRTLKAQAPRNAYDGSPQKVGQLSLSDEMKQNLGGYQSDSIQEIGDANHIDSYEEISMIKDSRSASKKNLQKVNFNEFSNDKSIQQQISEAPPQTAQGAASSKRVIPQDFNEQLAGENFDKSLKVVENTSILSPQNKHSQKSLATAELRKQLEGDFSDEFEYESNAEKTAGGAANRGASKLGFNTEERRFQAQQAKVQEAQRKSVQKEDPKKDSAESGGALDDDYEVDEFI